MGRIRVSQMRVVSDGYREGIKCIFIRTEHPDMLSGYLIDIMKKVFLDFTKGVWWYKRFFNEVYGRQIIPLEGRVSYASLYFMLGVRPEYRDGRIVAIWWPCWISSDVEVPDSLSFEVRRIGSPKSASLLHRAYVKNCTSNFYKTEKFHRQLLCYYKGVSEDSIRGKDTDHHNRFTSCNTRDNLFVKSRKDNLSRQPKRGIVSTSKFKGVSLTKKGEKKFQKHVRHPDTGEESLVAFECCEDLAVKLYDWHEVYVKETPQYYWQLVSLKREDIYSLSMQLSDMAYYRYLLLIWNTSDLGRELCKEIIFSLKRKIKYKNIVKKKSIIELRLAMRLGGNDKYTKRGFYSEKVEFLLKIQYYYNYSVLGVKNELQYPLVENIKDEEEFFKLLKETGNYDRMRKWLCEINTFSKKYRGKLTEFISRM